LARPLLVTAVGVAVFARLERLTERCGILGRC
jgi:hypothetical protein